MSESNLHAANKILLKRCPNGWTAENDGTSLGHVFAFETTESLARQLVRLLGKSQWTVTTPERDEKGHFKPKPSATQ